MDFRWNGWNIEHIARHGVSPEEAESVVCQAKRPFPRKCGEGKFMVWGRGDGGRFLQVIFALDAAGTVYVLHSRPLTDIEKQRFRRSEKP
jgi:hypothetical protein